MFERASARMLPLATRAAEHAPMATACCNACRTCVSTNVFALALAAAGGAGAFLARLAKQMRKPPSQSPR